MRRKITLNNIELDPILQNEIDQNIDDILEFCPEYSSIDVLVNKSSKNKNMFEVQILLKGPSLKVYSCSEKENVIESIKDCKRKVLSQFKRHRNKTALMNKKRQAKLVPVVKTKTAA